MSLIEQEEGTLPVTQVEEQTTALISMVERVAMNPEADIDKLEKLLDMQERVMDREAELAFNRAMVKSQSEMPIIVQKETNTQTSSKYANLEAVNRQVVPVYTANGFSVSFDTDESPLENHIRIVAIVRHAQGHAERFKHDLPIDNQGIAGKINKTMMHGRASTVTYGERYLICMIFNVSTADNDGNTQEAPAPETTRKDLAATHAFWIQGVKDALRGDLVKAEEVWQSMSEEVRKELHQGAPKNAYNNWGPFTSEDKTLLKQAELAHHVQCQDIADSIIGMDDVSSMIEACQELTPLEKQRVWAKLPKDSQDLIKQNMSEKAA